MDGIDNPPFMRRVLTNKTERVPRRDLLRAAPAGQGLGHGSSACARLMALGCSAASWTITSSRSHGLSSRRWIVMDACSPSASSPAADRRRVLLARGGRERAPLSLRLPRREADRRADLLHRRDERPVQNLDPALTRPGRMGRHVNFRTPTKDDRKDIFDLYLDKVAHDPDLDTPAAARRDRADHERLLARDDRPDLLDGADERAPRGLADVHVEAPRRRDDRDRVGHRDQRQVHTTPTRARSRSTRPATPPRRTSTCPRSSRAASRSRCAAAASATTSRSRRRSASAPSRAGCSAS